MRVGPLLGLAACLALPACAPDSGYYDGYGASGYAGPDAYYGQPYGYVGPSRRGYARDRYYRDRDYRGYRGDGERFERQRFDRDNSDQRRRQDDQVRQQPSRPPPPPQQTGPIQGGLFPGVPRPMPR